jgi:hypothetical protein
VVPFADHEVSVAEVHTEGSATLKSRGRNTQVRARGQHPVFPICSRH